MMSVSWVLNPTPYDGAFGALYVSSQQEFSCVFGYMKSHKCNFSRRYRMKYTISYCL